jgi:hypothetical protein
MAILPVVSPFRSGHGVGRLAQSSAAVRIAAKLEAFDETGAEGPSVRALAQQRPECHFSGTVGLCHGFEKNLGVLDRAGSAGAINLPSPRFRRWRTVLYDNGKVFMVEHERHIITEYGETGQEIAAFLKIKAASPC